MADIVSFPFDRHVGIERLAHEIAAQTGKTGYPEDDPLFHELVGERTLAFEQHALRCGLPAATAREHAKLYLGALFDRGCELVNARKRGAAAS